MIVVSVQVIDRGNVYGEGFGVIDSGVVYELWYEEKCR